MSIKNKVIKLIKKNRFLFNLAKKVSTNINSKIVKKSKYKTDTVFYTYVLKEKEELDNIKKHYDSIKKSSTKLFVIINNPKLNSSIHKFIRENKDICFASLEYFKTYNKKVGNYKFLLAEYNDAKENEEILGYIS